MKTTNPALQEKRRQEIFDAAIECFVQHGFHQTGMRQISEQAGVSLGTLYRYFSNKEAIIFAIAEHERQELHELLDALEKADNIIDSIVEIIPFALAEGAHPEYASLGVEVIAEATRNTKIASVFQQQDREVRKRLKNMIDAGVEKGLVDSRLPAEQVVELLIALYEGLEGRIIFNPDFHPDTIKPAFEQLIRRFLNPATGE